MNKKEKTQRGITLIALVITIIVMLILVGVTINMAVNGGLFEKAGEAVGKTKNALNAEQTILSDSIEELLNENDPNRVKWIQETITETDGTEKEVVTNGTTSFEIGATVDYVSGVTVTVNDYNGIEEPTKTGVYESEEIGGEWKILGVENGRILLVASKSVVSEDLFFFEKLYDNDLGNNTDKAIKIIEDACVGFNQGVGAYKSIPSRSIRIEDINRITGYDPMKQKDGTRYGAGELHEYGNKVVYAYELQEIDTGYEIIKEYCISCTVDGKPETKTYSALYELQKPNGEFVEEDETYTTEKNTYYEYKGADYLQTNDLAYDMLFSYTDDGPNYGYFLSSSFFIGGLPGLTPIGEAFGVGVREVCNGYVAGEYIWCSPGDPFLNPKGIRPVVTLKTNVQLEEIGENSYKIVENN